MSNNSMNLEPSQARKEKLTESLTGVSHGPTPQRSPESLSKATETASETRFNVYPADERLKNILAGNAGNVTAIPNELFNKTDVSVEARLVWIDLKRYISNDQPLPSKAGLANQLNLSETEIEQDLNELRGAGLVRGVLE